jgi:hypothetical protein
LSRLIANDQIAAFVAMPGMADQLGFEIDGAQAHSPQQGALVMPRQRAQPRNALPQPIRELALRR